MNIFVKLVLITIVMIIGFGAMIMGLGLLQLGNQGNFVLAVGLLSFGLVFGPSSLWLLIYTNREFQRKALEELLNQPERIIAQFIDKENNKNIIIGDNVLFWGKQHHPFQSFYQKLKSWKWEEGRLELTFEINGGEYTGHKTIKIVPPQENREQIEKWISNLSNQEV